jgi:tetratricopeptide (TPR) repeat protein
MLLRLSSSAARLALIFLALFFCGALSFLSIRNARAGHNAEKGTRAGYERAAQLEPGNPENWYLLGRYWQYNLDESDPQRAVSAYRKSLSFDPLSSRTWLDLATAYELQDDVLDARDAYLHAKRVYPLSAEVAWRYGNFLLRQDEVPQAFAEIRRAVYVDPNLGGQAFSRCWRVDPDINAILDQVLPPSPPVYLQVIRELGQAAQLPAAFVVWNRLVSLHPQLQLRDAFTFTDALIQAGQVTEARHVWSDAVALSGMPQTQDPLGSLVWDGSFESGNFGGGFAWSFAPASRGVQVSLDSRQKRSGNESLRLAFDGQRNVDFRNVCQSVPVQPGVPYRLAAWIRTQGLATDEGPRLQISWRDSSATVASIETPDVNGTQPWTEVSASWTPGKGTQLAQICVIRHPSGMETRIRGSAWIDDVTLLPQPAESPRP